MNTPPVKLFDVILHPSLKKSWIHFDIEAIDEEGHKYFDHSSSYGCYAPPYPAFPCYAGENYFTNQHPHGYTLEAFDVNQIVKRIRSHEWVAGIKSIKFSNQVYLCPKTYVLWEWAKKRVEGVSHFEVKRLPKGKKQIYVCEEHSRTANNARR